MLGQWALSHTVCRPSERANRLSSWKFSPTGARAFSHSGLGAGAVRRGEICTSSMGSLYRDTSAAEPAERVRHSPPAPLTPLKSSPRPSVSPDQVVGRAVVVEVGIAMAL